MPANPGSRIPSPAPLQSEQLAERFKDEPLEPRQARTGELLDAKLTEPSGNVRFDAFVMRGVPGALGSLTPPPDEALRGRDALRTQWQVEGWLRTPKELIAAASSLASGQLVLPLELHLQPEEQEGLPFEYRAPAQGLLRL